MKRKIENIDVDFQDTFFKKALIKAVIYNNLEMVKFLIKNGAKVDLQEETSNMTALIYAVLEECPEIAKFLLT